MSYRGQVLIGTLDLIVEQCCAEGCGVMFAMPVDVERRCKADHDRWFYCPNGHRQHYTGPTTEDRLRNAEARERHLHDQLKAAEADADQVRLSLARDRHRFANGVCPCCNRSFENVARHMATKHPDYDPVALHTQPTAAFFRCSCGRTFETLHGLRIHQGRSRSARYDWTDPATPSWWRHLTEVSG